MQEECSYRNRNMLDTDIYVISVEDSGLPVIEIEALLYNRHNLEVYEKTKFTIQRIDLDNWRKV